MRSFDVTGSAKALWRYCQKINPTFEYVLLPFFPAIACAQFFLLIFLSLFGITSIVATEFLLYIHATVAMLTLVVTMAVDGHIRVDILSSRLSWRGKAWVELWGSLLCLCTTGFALCWLGSRYAYFSWLFLESSSTPSGLQGIFLFKSVLPFVGALLLWEGCLRAWKAFSTLCHVRTLNNR